MLNTSQNPAAVYRRVDLDARIEASANADLTRICLEEVVDALGLALIELDRSPDTVPRQALSRAQRIAVYLARFVAPDNPMRTALKQFYGGQSEVIARNLRRARFAEIKSAREDFEDLLRAAQ